MFDEEDSQALEYSDRVIKRKGRTLLTDKSARPNHGNLTLDKIPEKSFKKTYVKTVVDEGADDKFMNLSLDERGFLKEYRRLEDLEREKGIKFFECIGDPPASDSFVNGIEVKRQNFIDVKLDTISDKVVVPTDVDISA